MLKNTLYLVLISFLLTSCFKDKPKVLVFSKTAGFVHESIDTAKLMFLKLGKENDFEVDTTELAEDFNEENLKQYSAVVFLNTTGDVLNQIQQNEFMRFIQAGGGYLGIHAAADTEYDWWWYGKLVGAYFKSHPQQQNAVIKKVNDFAPDKKATIPAEWKKWDEWYNYKKIQPDINVLMNLDESTYEGGENGSNHPIIWYHDFDGGRSFYTGLGHTNQSYGDKQFQSVVLMGLKYAIGEGKLDYTKATAKHAPEANRFNKVVLGYFFNEPTEMTILADGKIIFLERKGSVKLYNPKTDSISVINTFNVWSKEEDGMMGLTKDPNFAQNNWLYIYYAHPTRSSNILSRFVFKEGSIDMLSEKEMLEVPVQRKNCCHTGGSLTFDAQGNLYLSTGDNTSPFESEGYSPADERPGRATFDAQGSSGNTNDLRGKILRIHPEPDGSYTIPNGNLFGKTEEKTRPEIYVMGNRNPYRISVDQKTGWLYWGEVGPDAGNDSDTYGPRGYDELNQAKSAGFFGWPYFVGGNYAYAEYDFAKQTIDPRHDANKPINNSPNNTGKMELPPVSPPFIFYPYDESPDFPLMKTGGRNAMAGPVYYSENYKGVEGAFPDYLDGKVIIYEWMRNWMRLLTLDKEGKIMDIEPFMDGVNFNNMIDMEFGSDGKLYILEYGTKWFGENMDARLSRIDFNKDNRSPVAMLQADKVSGSLPLTVNFSSTGSNDPDGDKVSYELVIDDKIQTSADGNFTYTFEKTGVVRPKLNVTDDKGWKSSAELAIIAGNESPAVSITIEGGNSTYYFPNSSINYKVSVTDKEDGSTDDGKIPAQRVAVAVNFMAQGYDSAQVASGHQKPAHAGKLLMAESDCKSCHLINQKSAGPSYFDVAKKYKGDTKAIETLSNKILSGGSGVWGNTPMAAHPQIKKVDASTMVDYILSLATEETNKSLPLTGATKFAMAPKEGPNFQSAYIISASYDDNGFGAAPSMPAFANKVLKAPVLTGGEAIVSPGITYFDAPTGSKVLMNIKPGSTATFNNIDLEGVKSIQFSVVEVVMMTEGGQVDVYLDSKDGMKLGTADFTTAPKIDVQAGVTARPAGISFAALTGKHNLVLVFVNPKADADDNLFIFGQLTLGN